MRLGGTLRLLEVGDAFPRAELGAQIESAARVAADQAAGLELGVSALVPGVSLERSLFALKKQLRAEGIRVRIVHDMDATGPKARSRRTAGVSMKP